MWNAGLIEVILSIPSGNTLTPQMREQSSRFHITSVKPEDFSSISDEAWGKTDILITDNLLPTPEQVPNLKWVQFYNHYDLEKINEFHEVLPNLQFTSADGVNVFERTRICLHQLTEFQNIQRNNHSLYYATVGIIGYDTLGRELARILKSFHCTILAATFNAMNPITTTFHPNGFGDPNGAIFDRLYPMQALPSMLAQCDYIINTLSLSNSSKKLITKETLALSKPSAIYVDASHQGVTDYETIAPLLESKKIRAIGLNTHPSPANVIKNNPLFLDLVKENFALYLNHQPLLNIIS